MLRRGCLWLTGRDLLRPPPSEHQIFLCKYDQNWLLNIGGPRGMNIYLSEAPNIIFRVMQRFMLGFKWRMIDKGKK